MAEIKINDLADYTSPASTDVLPIVDVTNDATKKVSIANLVALAAVSSVNSQTGAVVLDADNISDTSTTNKFTTAAEATKLAGIETGAEVNVNADWNSSSGDSQILNKPTIPAAYTDSDVDTHLNTSSASSNEVLSWSGTDYDWVAQSGGGATNLGVSTTTTAVTVTSDTGTNAAISEASNSAAGVMSVAHHNKLDGLPAAAVATTGGTFTGDVEFDGDIAADGVYTGAVTAVAALAIDCSSSNYFTKTINGNSTFTFTNVPATRAFGFTLELTHTSGTVTWPASVKFPGDTAPPLTVGKTHLFVFVTDDGGTRFRGAALVDYTN